MDVFIGSSPCPDKSVPENSLCRFLDKYPWFSMKEGRIAGLQSLQVEEKDTQGNEDNTDDLVAGERFF